jgi:hypothetical protein
MVLKSVFTAGEYELVVGEDGDDEGSQLPPAGTAWGPEEGIVGRGEDMDYIGDGLSGWAGGTAGNARPLSAGGGRGAEVGGGDVSSGKSRHSRKTARPRTAGRERMKEGDREDLLVLSSSSDAEGHAVCSVDDYALLLLHGSVPPSSHS